MKCQNSTVFLQIGKFLLILLFTYTGISKLLGHGQFAAQLSMQPNLAPVSIFLSWLLPVAELLTILLILFDRTMLLGLLSATFLMTVFTIYVGGMLLFQSSLPCSCGGVISSLSWKEHFVFNLFFVAVSITGLVLDKKQKSKLPLDKTINY